jgi:hypothetical protein
MKNTRVFVIFAAALALTTGAFVATAGAANPPPNDKIGGATVVSSLPFTDTVDTTAATTDATDAQANQSCGAPVTNNSVWYKFTTGSTASTLSVDTTGSDFSSGVLIAKGTPGSLTTQACGPVSTLAALSPRTTYYILAFDDSGAGGTLHIAMHGPGPRPKNDMGSRATVVPALPFSDTLDTTGATTGPNDTQANQTCGAPVTNNSVWYKFTAGPSDANFFVDGSSSDYAVGILVATGSPGALTTVSCGPFAVTTAAQQGITYYIMVFDFIGSGAGTLRLNMGESPIANVAVNAQGLANSAHDAQFSGSYRCANAGRLEIYGSVTEVVGENVAAGSYDNLGIPAPTCDGIQHPWSAKAIHQPDPFVPFAAGDAAVLVFNLTCNDVVCTGRETAQAVHLATSVSGSAAHARVSKRGHLRVFGRTSRPIYGTAVHKTTASWGK